MTFDFRAYMFESITPDENCKLLENFDMLDAIMQHLVVKFLKF